MVIIQEKRGFSVIRVASWAELYNEFRSFHAQEDDYVWRGHRQSSWTLMSALDRLQTSLGPEMEWTERDSHLQRFKAAVRGRRGVNPPDLGADENWWALGQHYGLATPLLDWTRSPYVAAFFAFVDEDPGGQDQFRSVYALSSLDVADKNESLQPNEQLTFLTPQSDENTRLISQSGVFTMAPKGLDIEGWVQKRFKAKDWQVLIKYLVPNTTQNRIECLRDLNMMNINYGTLFPDLEGASRHCNLRMTIESY